MKNSKLKVFLVAGIATLGSLSTMAFSNPNSTPVNPENKWAINSDLSSIKANKTNILTLKEKLKNDCKAGDKAEVIMDKRELRKSKADLSRNETYLMADRKESIRSYELVISKWRSAVRDDKSRLALSKRILRKDVSKQDAEAIKTDAVLLTENQQLLKNDSVKLDREKKSRDADIAYINKGMRDANLGLFAMFENNIKSNTTGSGYATR